MRTTLIKKCIPLLVCACFPAAGSAATITSIQGGDWLDPATWQGGQVPSATDDVVLNHGVINSNSTQAGSITGPGSLTTASSLLLGTNGADSELNLVNIAGMFEFTGGGTLTLVDGTGIQSNVRIDGTLRFGMIDGMVNANSTLTSAGSTIDLNGFSQALSNLTSDGNINLGGSSLTTVGTSTITGTVTGSGSLVVDTNSSLSLSGNNSSYTGSTFLSSGSALSIAHNNALGSGQLIIDNASLANTGNITLNNNIIILSPGTVINAASNTRFELGGGITGTEGFRKTGTGELVISGVTNFAGTTVIEAGSLNLASTGILASGVEVENGATLSGTGTVGSFLTLQAGGILAPGNSIGTMNVNGTLTFNSGSFFNVELDNTGASDRVDVTGAAVINTGSTLNINGAAGTYGPSTTYTLINATSGITGTFSTINSNLAFLNPVVTNTGNQLQLTLTNNGVDFVDVARSYNQRNAALALMSVGAGTLAAAVTSLDADSARSAFSQLSGEIHASAQGALVDDTDFVRSAVTQRLYQPDGNAVWFKGSSIHGYTDRNSNNDSTARHMNGGLVGSDRAIGDGNWTAGIFGGYGDTNFNTQRSRADIKTVHLGAYAGRSFDNIQLKLGTGYAYHRLDTSRNLGFGTFTGRDKADYDAHSLQAFADVGYRFKSGDGSIEPFINLAQVYISREGFNERGDEAALSVSREQSNVTLGTLGVRLDQPLSNSSRFPLRLQGSLGYRHAEGDVTPKSEARLAGSSSFDIRGNPIARQAAVYDIGIYSQLSPSLSAGINYRGQNGDNTRIHAANFNLTWLF